MLVRPTTQEYICEKLLELMETTPFQKIKVIDLVNYANIGRSTFYLYFDSLYDVLQLLEDNYLAGLRPVIDNTSARALLVERHSGSALGNSLRMLDMDYIMSNRRLLRLLSGPNGDPYFVNRLTNRYRKNILYLFKTYNTTMTDKEQYLLSSCWASGIWGLMISWVNDESLSDKDLLSSTNYLLKDMLNMLS